MNRTNAVVIGGGTGAPASIRTLLDMGCRVSSVVAMVDDGGSTGILRERGGRDTAGRYPQVHQRDVGQLRGHTRTCVSPSL